MLPAADICLAAIRRSAEPVTLVAEGLEAIISFSSAYIVGTLPLKDIHPGPDVADGEEVSLGPAYTE